MRSKIIVNKRNEERNRRKQIEIVITIKHLGEFRKLNKYTDIGNS